MKTTYLLLLICFPCFVQAQRDIRKERRDSLRYYQKEMGRLYRETFDSLRSSEKFTSLNSNYRRLAGQSDSYGGLILFMDVYHSDYSQFNDMIAQEEFP